MGSDDSTIEESEQSFARDSFYTPNGIQCVWKDSNRFSGRLRQLELLNSVIGTLSARLWADARSLDFQDLINDAMVYVDPFKRPDMGQHNWSILADDKLFRDSDSLDNAFVRFENYLRYNGGKSPQDMQKDLLVYMETFVKLRAKLLLECQDECVPVPQQ